jgi:hypothetical protein
VRVALEFSQRQSVDSLSLLPKKYNHHTTTYQDVEGAIPLDATGLFSPSRFQPVRCLVQAVIPLCPFAMLTRTSRRSLSSIQHARRLSSTSNSSAAPIRKATQAATTKAATESTKRPQSTVATATSDRPTPSSAFNRDDIRYNDVSPLRSRQPELDHSFVGMKGGEIFHEMMLRHDVKHICINFSFSVSNKAVA